MAMSSNEDNPEFFIHLPSDIVTDILSRLPIRTIVICKCVCRPWRDLLRTREFAEFHLSRAVPGLLVTADSSDDGLESFQLFEFDDELDHENHYFHYRPVAMEFVRSSVLLGSANGLLLLRGQLSDQSHYLYVCNPITREYFKLPDNMLIFSSTAKFAYGFGVSRVTGQYKVVTILNERHSPHTRDDDGSLLKVRRSICLVYTLGTGIWRSVRPPTPFLYDDLSQCHGHSLAVCVNGNLHWSVQVPYGSNLISCFDLETEAFSTRSLPSPRNEFVGLAVLRDCLWVYDVTYIKDNVVIRLMKDCGDEKCWSKEFFIIQRGPGKDDYRLFHEDEVVHPINVFKDGDILMARNKIYYFNKTKTSKQSQLFRLNTYYLCGMVEMLHTPSFISLISLVNEKVIRF